MSKEYNPDIGVEFSRNIDRLLEGARAEECNVLSEEYRKDLAFAERLIRTHFRPGPAVEEKVKRVVQKEPGPWMTRISVPGLGLARRPVWIGALVGIIFIGLTIMVRSGIGVAVASALEQTWTLILQRVGVREVARVGPPVRSEEGGVEEYATLAEAQAEIEFPIRAPSYLPPGFRLEGVQVFSPSSVALNYRWDGQVDGRGQVELLSVHEYRPEAGPDIFEVGEGVSEEISLRGRPAILIVGRGWADGRRWRTDRGYILIWEEGDRVFALWSTLSREEIIRVASSMIQ